MPPVAAISGLWGELDEYHRLIFGHYEDEELLRVGGETGVSYFFAFACSQLDGVDGVFSFPQRFPHLCAWRRRTRRCR